MNRIFLTLAVLASLALVAAIVLGLQIGDPKSLEAAVQSQISRHMLIGVGALTFATLVHAVMLTYFMGTGRWIEETSHAYSLSAEWHQRSQKIKYGLLPGMTFCLLLLIATGALGAAADPATPVSLDGTVFGLSGATLHLVVSITTVVVNLVVNVMEFAAIVNNVRLIEGVLVQVRTIRQDRGLPVE